MMSIFKRPDTTERGGRLFADLVDSAWYITPEYFNMFFSMLSGDFKFDEKMALEKRMEIKKLQDSRMKLIGNTNIAYIPVMGAISPRATFFSEVCGATTIAGLTEEFVRAREDPDIEAILLDFDTPGGSATGINAFSDLVFSSREVKPVFGYVDGTCASAGFWIGSATDRLIIDATGRVGSVGTVVGVPKKGESDRYIEVTNTLSPFKRPDMENSEHYADVVRYLDEMTDVFYSALSRNFGVSVDFAVKNFGKGGIKVGSSAVESKMAHSVNSFDGCIEELLAEVDKKKKQRVQNYTSEAGNHNGGNMDIQELKANHPDLVEAIKKETEEGNSSVIAGLKCEVEALQKKNEDLSSSIISANKELSEKNAKDAFSEVFSESNIPENFSGKVFKDTNLESFIGEDGKLDEKGYRGSVSAAVKSWEADFAGVLIEKNEDKNKGNNEPNEESTEENSNKEVFGSGNTSDGNGKGEDGSNLSLIDEMVALASR